MAIKSIQGDIWRSWTYATISRGRPTTASAIEKIIAPIITKPMDAQVTLVPSKARPRRFSVQALYSKPIITEARTPKAADRSEERRVGKAGVSTCRSRWSQYHSQQKQSIKMRQKIIKSQ